MEFQGYRVDAVHRTVTAPRGRLTRLEPKAFDLLLYFSEHAEETLSRERLIEEVWGGKFVTGDAVQVAVYALRQAFDDDSRSPRFIETIRSRGYRWIGAASKAQPPRTRFLATVMVVALISSGVAALVTAVLRPPEPMPSIQRADALIRAHARGLFFSERSTLQAIEEARSEFRKAIRIDDRFAEPHAALAEACVRSIEFGSPETVAREEEARRELARALELAPQSALSQAALASVQFVLDRDVRKAESSFRYAMQLDPLLPDVHRRYSYLLGASGRFSEATEQARIATEMEPASAAAMNDLAWTQFLSGDVAAAERTYGESLRLDPVNVGALFSLGLCYELQGNPQEAMRSYRRVMEIRGLGHDAIDRYERIFASSGLPGVHAAWLDMLKARKGTPRFALAFNAARAGMPAEALKFLQESAQRREPGTLWLAVHPAFAPLRNHREFAGLVASSFHTR